MSALITPALELAVDEAHARGARVLALRGELDIHSAPRLRKLGERGPGDREPLVLDLSDLTLLDSSGLGAIVELFNQAERAGARFAVVARRTTTMRIFKVTGLTSVLGVVQTRREALARTSGS